MNKGVTSAFPEAPKDKFGWPWTVDSIERDSIEKAEKYVWPKISIITPSFNQGDYIEETIRSVLLQNYPNIEYIVIDGGSTDCTCEILKKYDPWIKYWHSERDGGQGNALNQGFSIATGEILGWINSDDLYFPDCFKKIARCIVERKAEFVYGDSVTIDEGGKWIKYEKGNLVLDRYLAFGGLISSHTAFWQSAIHVPVLESLHCAMDYELWRRLVPGKRRMHVKTPLGMFRLQDASKSCNEKFKAAWAADDKEIERIYPSTLKKSRVRAREFSLVQKSYKFFNRSNSI